MATISSTFDIVWNGSLAGTATATIANPGRAFSVVGMVTTGANGAVLTLTRSGAAGSVVVGTNTTAAPVIEGVVTPANIEFTSAQNLVLTASNAAATTRAVITCQASSLPAGMLLES